MHNKTKFAPGLLFLSVDVIALIPELYRIYKAVLAMIHSSTTDMNKIADYLYD
jgi:hypothetical protein